MIGSRETMGEEESGRITEGGKQSERRRGREKKERFFFHKNDKYKIHHKLLSFNYEGILSQ